MLGHGHLFGECGDRQSLLQIRLVDRHGVFQRLIQRFIGQTPAIPCLGLHGAPRALCGQVLKRQTSCRCAEQPRRRKGRECRDGNGLQGQQPGTGGSSRESDLGDRDPDSREASPDQEQKPEAPAALQQVIIITAPGEQQHVGDECQQNQVVNHSEHRPDSSPARDMNASARETQCKHSDENADVRGFQAKVVLQQRQREPPEEDAVSDAEREQQPAHARDPRGARAQHVGRGAGPEQRGEARPIVRSCIAQQQQCGQQRERDGRRTEECVDLMHRECREATAKASKGHYVVYS